MPLQVKQFSVIYVWKAAQVASTVSHVHNNAESPFSI